MPEKLDDPQLVHEQGSFDEFLLSFYWEMDGEEFKWSPKNEEVFQMLEMWFESEDEGYGEDAYGSMWQLFFIALTRLEGREEAVNNNQLKGWRAKEHFLKQVADHGDEILEEMEQMVEKAKKEREEWN